MNSELSAVNITVKKYLNINCLNFKDHMRYIYSYLFKFTLYSDHRQILISLGLRLALMSKILRLIQSQSRLKGL